MPSRPRPAPHGLGLDGILGLGLHDLGLRNPILPRKKVREYPTFTQPVMMRRDPHRSVEDRACLPNEIQ